MSLTTFINFRLFSKNNFIIFCFAVLQMSPFAHGAEAQLSFKNEQTRFEKSIPLNELKKSITPQTLTVWEPHENENKAYTGFSLVEVLNSVFKEDWKKYDLVLMVCADGYKAPILTSKINSFPSLLAYEVKNSATFKVNNKLQNQKDIELGPFYLVWDNLKNDQLRAEEASDWPYQVVSIELAQFKAKFPNLIPPEKSSTQVMNGFHHYQKFCITCHKLNGNGGDKGPALNLVSAFKDHSQASRLKLKKWISDPSKVRPTTMPALNNKIKNRNQVIDDIISYISAMLELKK